MTENITQCPLCSNNKAFTTTHSINKRDFFLCNECYLIFAEKSFLLNANDEKERYLAHENGIQFPGYVNFLNQAIIPSLKYVKPGMKGVDFGCGPTPTLSLLLKKENIECADYDPFFFPELPTGTFDFIFATECFEHFFNPKKEIENICSMLNPGAFLIVMTDLWVNFEQFPKWHYPNDTTHVVFYHEKTMQYVSHKFGLEIIESINQRVTIFRQITVEKAT